ncbi:MAG: hypothetical protein QW726_05805 [Fervidicoccaceae archaeon]
MVSLLISAVFNLAIGGIVVLALRNKVAEWISNYVVSAIEDLVHDYIEELKENPKALTEFINPILSSISKNSSSGGIGIPMIKLPILGKVPLNVALGLLNNFGLLKPQAPPTQPQVQPTQPPAQPTQPPAQPTPAPQVKRKPFFG